MGLLIDGTWHDQTYDTGATGGRFVRRDSAFRDFVTADGAPGLGGKGGFAAEPGRYHLYVSLACPWAHRTLIFRALKGLEAVINVSVVNWLMAENGWTFEEGPGVVPDAVEGGIQHADDLGGFVVDNRPRLLVPEHRHRHTTGIVPIGAAGARVRSGPPRFR